MMPGQNKKGQNKFQLHRFLNTFLQLAAEKKYQKNGAAGNFFCPSYFVTALVHLINSANLYQIRFSFLRQPEGQILFSFQKIPLEISNLLHI
jgi:hypothetical protein